MRTRSLAPLLALALPALLGPGAATAEEAQTFAPLDLRDEDEAVTDTGAPAEETVADDATPAAEDVSAGLAKPDPETATPEAMAGAAEEPAAGAAPPALPAAKAEAVPLGAEPAPADAPAPLAEAPFAVGLKADLLVPTSRVDSTGAISLDLRYRLPFHERRLAVAAEVGWYPLGGDGKSVDQQQGTFAFDWRLDSLPLHFGLEYLPPLPIRLPWFLERLRPYGEAGFAMAFLWSKASYRNAGGETFIRDNLQEDTAIGWYVGAGGLYRLGPGDLVGGYRHDGLKTDMDIPFANEESGDVGGSHVQAGYRLVF